MCWTANISDNSVYSDGLLAHFTSQTQEAITLFQVEEGAYVDVIDVQAEDLRRSVLNFPTNMLLVSFEKSNLLHEHLQKLF